jgi:hypothetical protein
MRDKKYDTMSRHIPAYPQRVLGFKGKTHNEPNMTVRKVHRGGIVECAGWEDISRSEDNA